MPSASLDKRQVYDHSSPAPLATSPCAAGDLSVRVYDGRPFELFVFDRAERVTVFRAPVCLRTGVSRVRNLSFPKASAVEFGDERKNRPEY